MIMMNTKAVPQSGCWATSTVGMRVRITTRPMSLSCFNAPSRSMASEMIFDK